MPDRAAAHRGSVGVGQPEQLGQQQGFALLDGEVGDHRGHFDEVLESARVAVAVAHLLGVGTRSGARPRLDVANVIDHHAPRDGQQPGAGGGASGESFDRPDCPQEGFLGQIIGAGRIGQVRDETPHVFLSGLDECLKSSLVPARGCQGEFGNGLVVA